MKLLFQARRFLSLGVLTLALGWQCLSSIQPSSAQPSSALLIAQSTTQLESRVSRLESENSTLRSQINQLQNSVARLGRNSGVELAPPVISSAPVGSSLADDPVFKRLATLVIELKERVVAVEDRLGGSTAPR